MNYSRPMIDLVYEIRRRVPSEYKPGVKLANPELLTELTQLVNEHQDIILHALVRELLSLAGEEWISQLDKPPLPTAHTKADTTLAYRGQLAASPESSQTVVSAETDAHKPVRIYRGQIISD